MVREQVLRQTRDEIPYGVAVEVEKFEEKPEKNLVVINAAIHVVRETHKKIIVGRQGSRLRAIGQSARHEIEKLLGTRVYLEWRRTGRRMPISSVASATSRSANENRRLWRCPWPRRCVVASATPHFSAGRRLASSNF